MWNPAMEALTGYRSDEALGRDASWLRAPDCSNFEAVAALMSEDSGQASSDSVRCINGCECRLRDRNGKSVPVLVNARPVRDAQGRLLGLLQTVTDFRQIEALRLRVENLEAEAHPSGSFHGLVGHSRRMRELYRLIGLAASSEASVLILGESGTGKELAASAIHTLSERSEGPLVRVNCGAIPTTLLESELFGHVKGAFTGAYRDRQGRFEAADGGTIFLDEVGDLSPEMQVKLLRVLQEGTFERVGGERTVDVDVRVVSATNHDLHADVQAGLFREDLYYRLRVFPLHMPALRDRAEDIPALVGHFVRRFAASTGRPIEGVSSDALALLMSYCWPGNVRELENAVEYAFVVCQSPEIEPEHLPMEIRSAEGQDRICSGAAADNQTSSDQPPPLNKTQARRITRDPEKLTQLLHECDWNKAEAARRLGLSRTAVWKWMKQHSIPLQQPDRS
jgi:PAS domain S-box-containing protein